MSDILDTIPFDYIFDNIKSNNLSVKSTVKKELNLLFHDSQNSQNNQNNQNREENEEYNLDEEYSDVIDKNISDNDKINKKNRIPKLLITILFYLNYVNYKKTNKNKILIKSKL